MDEKSLRLGPLLLCRFSVSRRWEKTSNSIYVLRLKRYPLSQLYASQHHLITTSPLKMMNTFGKMKIPLEIYIYYSVIMHEFVFIYIFISSFSHLKHLWGRGKSAEM